MVMDSTDAGLCKQSSYRPTAFVSPYDIKTIELFSFRDKDFSAEDLLNLTSAFGYVTSVQVKQMIVEKDLLSKSLLVKISAYLLLRSGVNTQPRLCKLKVETVKGTMYGLVTFSNADEAELAMRTLNNDEDFCDALLKVWEDREPEETRRSKNPKEQHPCLLKNSYKTPKTIPSLLDTPCPPAYRKEVVCLFISNLPQDVDNRYQVLNFLRPYIIYTEELFKGVLVTVADLLTALWMMDFVRDFYTGSRRLRVCFADQGSGEYLDAPRAPHTKQRHTNSREPL